jgi:hypothetical protein
MLKPRLSVVLFAALLTLLSSGFADTVTLKSGEKLEGKILSETDTEVTIEVSVTSSIKDQRVVKKADVDKIDKVQPDAEAWAGLKNISVGEESLEPADYQRYIAVLSSFVSQFPQSTHAAEAKQKVAALQEEAKRVDAGEMKLGGKWLTADEVKRRLQNVTGPDKAQLEAMQKQQTTQTEAAVAGLERSGAKWLPLTPATDRSLAAISTKAAGTLQSLNRHNVDQMKASVAATDRVRDALAADDASEAEKALAEATKAWSQNEYIARLQPKVLAAKAKAAEAARAAAKPVAATGPASKQAKATPAPASAPVVEEPPKEDGSVLTKPAFWIILILVVGLGAYAMKVMGKFGGRKNDLDPE